MLVGKRIDNFSFEVFKDGDIKRVDLNSYLGKWLVLFFYPADFTFICPTELESLADKYDLFKSEGAEVVSMSRDTAFVHKAWHESDKRIGKIKYFMGSDISGSITRYFDVFETEDKLALRATFIIDPKGIVKSAEVNDNSIGRNIDEILRKLQAAIFTSKNSGEVCPVNWTKSSNSLKLPTLSILK